MASPQSPRVESVCKDDSNLLESQAIECFLTDIILLLLGVYSGK